MTSEAVLLSIKPEFAEAILAGRKLFEYRSRLPARELELVVVYASAPVGRIVGAFTVAKVITDSPAGLWTRTFHGASIDRGRFNEYFAKRTHAHGLAVAEVLRFAEPIDPRAIGPGFRAPQWFVAVDRLAPGLEREIAWAVAGAQQDRARAAERERDQALAELVDARSSAEIEARRREAYAAQNAEFEELLRERTALWKKAQAELEAARAELASLRAPAERHAGGGRG